MAKRKLPPKGTDSGSSRRAAAYARFSSDRQREESIDAQMRAIREYAERNGYEIVSVYQDYAQSATTDRRPEFQRMIADARQGDFDYLIVHKLDRFSRDRYDSVMYKRELERCGVRLLSVSENLDGSPESLILESVIEGMAAYYSQNLAREVEKGKRENALKAVHVGGRPPLGYDVDPVTRQLIVNSREAEAVRLIFSKYLEGEGYTAILNALNAGGYRTKLGQPFGKNSLYEILRNEKYTGTYVYGKTAPKDVDGRHNRHSFKPDDEIIRVPDAFPAIISREDFEETQRRMSLRKHMAGRFAAKEVYLLSGKIVCAQCGFRYCGHNQPPRPDHPQRTVYRCTRRNGAVKCGSKAIRRDDLDDYVLFELANRLFTEETFAAVQQNYARYLQEQNAGAAQEIKSLQGELARIETGIANILSALEQGHFSTALSNRLQQLEQTKSMLELKLRKLENAEPPEQSEAKLRRLFAEARKKLTEGTLPARRMLVEKFVEKVVINQDTVTIHFRLDSRGHDPPVIRQTSSRKEAPERGPFLLAVKALPTVTVSREYIRSRVWSRPHPE
ncbi:MAG: recombinase family protein [Oscillospiraceae bacterium]|nr:recombinase family protein [Oscillospiraceae bacterium]